MSLQVPRQVAVARALLALAASRTQVRRSDEVRASSLVPQVVRVGTPRQFQEIRVVLHQLDVKSDTETDGWSTHPSSEFLVDASLEGLGNVETML